MSLSERVSAWFKRLKAPKTLGQQGERAAARYLKRLGYKIVSRGSRSRHGSRSFGELDMVAVDGQTVVFVEVKTRSSHDAGHPAEAVDLAKQKKLTRLALTFLKRHELLEHSSRFDVVAITWPPEIKKPKIEHYKNAFEPVGQGQMFS